jgi:2-phospho-L-lactate guanylyltransferase
MNAAVVPIKALHTGKTRLHGELAREHVEALCLAMMQDVVAALLAASHIDRVVVATPDAAAADAARAMGAEVFEGPDSGLNAAIESASKRLADEGAQLVLTVLGDVAGAEGEDFAALVHETEAAAREADGRAVGLAPSADGGSSALARMPADVIPARFGPRSARAHRSEADTAGVPLVELDLSSLRLDLDRGDDIEDFVALGRGGPRTRACLADIGWRSTRTDEEER